MGQQSPRGGGEEGGEALGLLVHLKRPGNLEVPRVNAKLRWLEARQRSHTIGRRRSGGARSQSSYSEGLGEHHAESRKEGRGATLVQHTHASTVTRTAVVVARSPQSEEGAEAGVVVPR